jgi:hypothetical protein
VSFEAVATQLTELYEAVQKLLEQVVASADSDDKSEALKSVNAVSTYLKE